MLLRTTYCRLLEVSYSADCRSLKRGLLVTDMKIPPKCGLNARAGSSLAYFEIDWKVLVLLRARLQGLALRAFFPLTHMASLRAKVETTLL